MRNVLPRYILPHGQAHAATDRRKVRERKAGKGSFIRISKLRSAIILNQEREPED